LRRDVDIGVGQAVEASVLDLGLRRVPPVPLVFGNGVPLYASTHAPTARLAGEGLALLSTMRYLAPGSSPADPATAKAELRRLATLAGVTDDDVLMERYLHRVVVSHGYPTAHGRGLQGRPAIDAAGVPHAFLAGDWVGQAGLLADASTASGIAAAQAAVRLLRVAA
jgi:hypothetical protein